MSGTIQNHEEDAQGAPTNINDESIQPNGRSESIRKSLDLSTTEKFHQIVNEDRPSVLGDNNKNNNKEEPAKVTDNASQINPEADGTINSVDPFIGFPSRDNDEVPTLHESQFDDSKASEEKYHDCGGDCICKIKEALGLIVEEIKKVDVTIGELEAKSQCPYTPEPDDKKEFAKSVEKNSSVCHVIIGELKKQRKEINEMLELYEESSREFSKLEITLTTQREKIEHMESILESIEDELKNVKADFAKRQECFSSEREARRTRVETREEILKVFLNWIMSLDAKRYDEREAADSMVKEAMEETEEDRATLTLAVRQLQEVKRIETLLMTKNRTTTEETQQTTVPNSSCKCAWPINKVTIVPGQCNRMACVPRVNPGAFFNINANRCSGGADGLGVGNALGTNTVNGNGQWFSTQPIVHYANMPGPSICLAGVPTCRLNSPTNYPRRLKRKMKNGNL